MMECHLESLGPWGLASSPQVISKLHLLMLVQSFNPLGSLNLGPEFPTRAILTTENFTELQEEKGSEEERRKGEEDTRKISGVLSPTLPDSNVSH